MPVEQITNVVSNVLYGIMVTNFFNGQPKPPDVQAKEILDIVFLGILTESERGAGQVETPSGEPRESETRRIGFTRRIVREAQNAHESTLVDGPDRCRCWRARRRPGASRRSSAPTRPIPIAVYDLPVTRDGHRLRGVPRQTDSPSTRSRSGPGSRDT